MPTKSESCISPFQSKISIWIPEPTIPNNSVNARVNKVLKESEETGGSGVVGGSKFLFGLRS